MKIRSVIIKARTPTILGIIFSEEALKDMAERHPKKFEYDPVLKELIYILEVK